MPNKKDRPSDKDTGFLWGKAGRIRAKQVAAKANAGFKMWENEGKKRKKKK